MFSVRWVFLDEMHSDESRYGLPVQIPAGIARNQPAIPVASPTRREEGLIEWSELTSQKKEPQAAGRMSCSGTGAAGAVAPITALKSRVNWPGAMNSTFISRFRTTVTSTQN